jgi:uncharacterized protein YkuJ
MNPTQLKRVVIVLAVVIVFWLLAELLGGGPDDSETAFVLPALQMSEVDAVTITRPAGTNALVRVADSTWTVNGYAAEQSQIEGLFEGLSEAVEAELVATGSAVHGRMEIDSAQGSFVRFENDGETLASVVFGKQGRAYNSRYVRLEGEDFVYQFTGQLASAVNRNETDWRDKDILSIEPDSVGRVVARRSEGGYTLSRDEAGWLIGRGEATDSAAVHRMINQYNSLQASGFATEEQVDSTDFSRPDRTVTLFGLEGETLASLAFDSTNAAYWLRVESDSTIYRILQWKANQMIPVDSTLRANEDEG